LEAFEFKSVFMNPKVLREECGKIIYIGLVRSALITSDPYTLSNTSQVAFVHDWRSSLNRISGIFRIGWEVVKVALVIMIDGYYLFIPVYPSS